jgi:predicted RNase H-like nuclease (RuvC/YqgF family)
MAERGRTRKRTYTREQLDGRNEREQQRKRRAQETAQHATAQLQDEITHLRGQIEALEEMVVAVEAEKTELEAAHDAEVRGLHVEMEQINHHNKRLTKANRTLDAQLCAESKQLEMVTANIRTLMNNLPPLSPFRRSLVRVLSTDMRRVDALNLLQISRSTYQRARQLDTTNLSHNNILYPLNTHKKMVSDARHDLATTIFEDHAPVRSGHDHRIKYEDDCSFFKRYVEAATQLRPDLAPVSKSYYMSKVQH